MSLETYNFHLYIGSKAKFFCSETFMDLCGNTHIPCEKMIVNSCDGSVGFYEKSTSFRCGTANLFKLILRPIKSMTNEEISDLSSNTGVVPLRVDFKTKAAEIGWLIKNGFDVGLVPRDRYVLTTELNNKEERLQMFPPQKIANLKALLGREFGTVTDCGDIGDGMFRVVIQGIGNYPEKIIQCLQVINKEIGSLYSKVHTCSAGEDIFYLILRREWT